MKCVPVLETTFVGPDAARRVGPGMVFLHEGLGSIELWRDFPEALCARLGWEGLVYSRVGYGWSGLRPGDGRVPADYLEREAIQALPDLLAASEMERPWLLGHSDGGSIALIAAACAPERYAGIVVIAPHYCVEDKCLEGILRAREAFEHGDLRKRLARYHDNVDAMFYGWCDTWLDPARRGWSIEPLLASVRCPVLAIQGVEDEYATLDQIEAIARHAPQTELLKIPDCGHFPFLKQPDVVIEAIAAFVAKQSA